MKSGDRVVLTHKGKEYAGTITLTTQWGTYEVLCVGGSTRWGTDLTIVRASPERHASVASASVEVAVDPKG